MIRAALAALAISAMALPPAAARADERAVTIGGFERVRVLGPFQVVVSAERTPAAVLSGDAAAIEAVEVVLDGGTLTVRGRIGGWGERPRAAFAVPVVIRVGSDALVGATAVAGGRLRIARMKGARIDLAVTGAGTIAVDDIDADATVATLIGGGGMTLAGRSGQARLLTNGTGTIDAAGFVAGDLTVRLDGPGSTSARARFTAHVVDTGLGQVTVAGSPKCTVVAPAGGPVTCGAGR